MPSIRERIEQMKCFLRGDLSKDDCNLVYHETSDVADILQSGIGGRKYRIATSGYSFDQDGYKDTTTKFLKALDKCLGRRNTGYITTPAVADGSIYDITTQVSGLGKSNVAYLTTSEYWANTDFESFRKGLNLRQYVRMPIHIFPDTKTYIDAMSNASNILVCTGGRRIAITEIVEALRRKSKVVLLINNKLKNEGFCEESGQVENAAKYFVDYMLNCRKDLPKAEQLDLDFLTENPGRALHLLRVYFVDDEKEIGSAAMRAANFLKSETIYDYFPDKAEEIDRQVGAVVKQIDQQKTMEHWLKTGEIKSLYK